MIDGPGHGEMDQPLIADCLKFMEKVMQFGIIFFFVLVHRCAQRNDFELMQTHRYYDFYPNLSIPFETAYSL